MTTSPYNNEIADNLKRIKENVYNAAVNSNRSPQDIKIMAVTKTVDPKRVNMAIDAGIELLGENRVQEFLSKRDEYNLSAARVDFIGHLQTNKVKYIIDKVSMIQSVSSLKLAKEINKCANKNNIVMDILLEVNIGNEGSKSGFLKDEITLTETLEALANLSNVNIKGLMCIPPVFDAEKYLYETYKLFVDIREKKLDNINMDILSMGMSNDYELAVKHGSNLVRLGTALFGTRK